MGFQGYLTHTFDKKQRVAVNGDYLTHTLLVPYEARRCEAVGMRTDGDKHSGGLKGLSIGAEDHRSALVTERLAEAYRRDEKRSGARVLRRLLAADHRG